MGKDLGMCLHRAELTVFLMLAAGLVLEVMFMEACLCQKNK